MNNIPLPDSVRLAAETLGLVPFGIKHITGQQIWLLVPKDIAPTVSKIANLSAEGKRAELVLSFLGNEQ